MPEVAGGDWVILGSGDDDRAICEGYPARDVGRKAVNERRRKVKEFLWQYLWISEMVDDMERDLEDLREISGSLSVNLDGMPRGTDISDRTGNAAARLADLSSAITEEKMKREEKRWEIMGVISKVKDPVLYKILRKRYIDFSVNKNGRKRLRRWEKIAEEMDYYDLRYVYRKHNQALDEVARILAI